MFKQFLFFGITILGQVVTFGAATIVVISDKQSFTYKSCTKQNIAMQEVIFYYQYKGKVRYQDISILGMWLFLWNFKAKKAQSNCLLYPDK